MCGRIARLLLVAFATAAVAVAAGVVALTIDFGYVLESVSPARFDAGTWRAADTRSRGSMVGDLVDRDLLIGKSREDVVALLGPPDRERERALLYNVDIGLKFAGTPWIHALHVVFDAETGLVARAFYVD